MFRDDHDAAIARADALEGEVETMERRAQAAERERDELEAQLAEARAASAKRPAGAPPSWGEGTALKLLLLVLLVGVVLATVLMLGTCGRSMKRQRHSELVRAPLSLHA